VGSPSRPEIGRIPPATEVERLIAEFRTQVVAPLNAWLASLENIHFASKAEAQLGVRRILQLVRAAGCEVVFADKRVNLTVSTGTRQKAPSIRAVNQRTGRGVVLASSVRFPRLHARPVSLPESSEGTPLTT
jgi:hypothetical protein